MTSEKCGKRKMEERGNIEIHSGYISTNTSFPTNPTLPHRAKQMGSSKGITAGKRCFKRRRAGTYASADDSSQHKPTARASGLLRTPLSGGVNSATLSQGLPPPAVAVRNLMEQVCTSLNHSGSCSSSILLQLIRIINNRLVALYPRRPSMRICQPLCALSCAIPPL